MDIQKELEIALKRISELEEKLYIQEQHFGFEIFELKSKNRYFLQYKLKPLLTDVKDALEIECPQVALKRVKNSLILIGECDK